MKKSNKTFIDELPDLVDKNIKHPILGDEYEMGKYHNECTRYGGKKLCGLERIYEPSRTFRNTLRMTTIGAGIGGIVSRMNPDINNDNIGKSILTGATAGAIYGLINPLLMYTAGKASAFTDKTIDKIKDILRPKLKKARG